MKELAKDIMVMASILVFLLAIKSGGQLDPIESVSKIQSNNQNAKLI